MTYIDKREFDLIGNLDDEQDMLETFTDYDGYICDAIAEMADNYIPIYNNDVWKNVADIQEYVESAIDEGIAPIHGREVDLVKIFQSGYYQYYSQSAHQNLSALSFNVVVEKVNKYLNELTEEDFENIDLLKVEEAIESETENYDHNLQMDSYDDVANDIIERIKENEFLSEE